MATIVQVNLRAPEGDKAVLAEVAARLREGQGFAERLSAFLAAEGAGAAWADRLEAIERRLEALEAAKGEKATLLPPDASSSPRAASAPAIGVPAEDAIRADDGQVDLEGLLKSAPDDPVEPAGTAVEGEEDWTAKAAAITTTTGEGKGRKLTDAGAGLFAEMLAAGVPLPSIARTVGISPQSAHTRAKKLGAGG